MMMPIVITPAIIASGLARPRQPAQLAGEAEDAASDDVVDHQTGEGPSTDRPDQRHAGLTSTVIVQLTQEAGGATRSHYRTRILRQNQSLPMQKRAPRYHALKNCFRRSVRPTPIGRQA